MKFASKFARALGPIILCIASSLPVTAYAANIWDGGGADTNLNTALNWDDDAVPNLTGGTTLTFATAGSTATVNIDTSLAGINFNRDADFTLANGTPTTLTLGSGGITLNQPGPTPPETAATSRRLTIAEPLTLSAAQTWTANPFTSEDVTTVPNLTISGAITGTNPVTLTRSGTTGTFGVSVSGNNSAFSGAWIIGQGINLRNETANPTSALGTGTIIFQAGVGANSGSILAFNQGFTGAISNAITINNAATTATIQNFGGFSGNNAVTFSGNFTTGAAQATSGGLNLNPKAGSGVASNTESVYRLTGNWTTYGDFSGSANLVSITGRGTVEIGSANAIASTANPSRVTYRLTANDSASLQSDPTVKFSAKLILGGAYTLANPVLFTGSTSAPNYNSLGARNASGTTATFSGLLTQNTDNSAGLNLFAQSSGAVTDFTGNIVSQAVTDTNRVRVNAPYSYQGGLGLTNQTPAGTVKFTGAKTYFGPTAVNGGTLNLAGSILNSSGLTIAGGNLLLPDGGTNKIKDTAPVTLGGDTPSSLTLSGTVSETAGVLTLAGSAASTLDYGSGAGTLRFADSSGVTWPGTAQIINWSGGTTDRLYVGTNASGLTSDQRTRLTFLNPRQLTGSFNSIQKSDGEVVPEGWTGSASPVLTSTSTTPAYGDSVTFTAFIHTDGVIQTGATGNIVFKVDGTTAQTVAVSSGQATFTTTTLAFGLRSITATYSVGGTATRTVTVGTAPVTITAFNLTKTQGLAKALTGMEFTATGLKNGDTIGSVTLTASGGLATADPVGTYSLTPSAATGGSFNPANYTLTYFPGTLAVLGTIGTGATDIQAIYDTWPTANKQTLYVKTNGNDTTGTGTDVNPYASIKKALSVATGKKKIGVAVKIIIFPGTYREGAPGDSNGFSFNIQQTDVNAAPLILEGQGWNAATPSNTGDVIVSCSDDWSGVKGPASILGWTKNTVNNTWTRSGTTVSAAWTQNADGTWSKPWPYNWGVPTKSVSFGVADAFLRRELVVVNGQPYYQINPAKNLDGTDYVNVNSVDGVFGGGAEGDNITPTNVNGGRLTAEEGAFWVHDATLDLDNIVTTLGRITIKPPANAVGFDPNATANLIEVSTRRNGFQFWVGNGSTATLSSTPTNVVIRNLTFQHSGRYGSLIQGQNNLLIEDCRFIKGKRTGLAVLLSQGATLRRLECASNGEDGAMFFEGINGLLEYCKFNNNSRQGEILGFTGWSVSGIKLRSTKGANANVTVYRCEARNNRSTGFWWDTGCIENLMLECVSVNNSGNGTFIEDNNDTSNNFSQESSTGVDTEGIPNLGTRPTVTVLRSILANNKPPAETLAYRTNKNGGVFFSENENAVIDGNLIYGNHIQISTYDNDRGEQRNFTFRNNLIAAQSTDERLYAVKSNGDSAETITLKQLVVDVADADSDGNTTEPLLDSNGKKQYVNKTSSPQTIKGGWYAMYDGLSTTTNDNVYFHPSTTAFPARSQRWGTESWTNPAKTGFPNQSTLTLAQWKQTHKDNTNNSFTDRRVDSRSTLVNTAYDDTKPLVAITPLVDSLIEGDPATAAFNVTRVSAQTNGYDAALTVAYTVRTQPGDAANGTDLETLSGTVIIPAGQRSATINVTTKTDALLEFTETIALVLDTTAGTYVAANPTGTVLLFDVPPPTDGPAAAPSFSPDAAAIYAGSVTITLASATAGATIHYTTDGTTPTRSVGTVYTGAFTISTLKQTTIKAVAYSDNYDLSTVASATYQVRAQVAINTSRASAFVAANGTATRTVTLTNNTASTQVLNLALNLPGTSYLSDTYRVVTTEEGSSVAEWKSIAATGTSLWNYTGSGFDDVTSSALSLGFSIPYFGNSYSTIRVCTNGWASFTATATAWNNQPLSTQASTIPNGLFPMWDNLVIFDNLSYVYYQQRTDANGPEFVIQWDNLKQYTGDNRFTFQVILRPSGEIIYLYKATPDNYASSTTGLLGGVNSDVIQLNHNTASDLTKGGSAIQFYRPWATLSTNSLTLAPGESRTVDVSLNATYLPSSQEAVTTLIVTPVSSGLVVSNPIPVSLKAGTSTAVEQWPYRYFGVIDNSGNAADSANPDGDAFTNATEYANGTDPTIPNPTPYIFTGTGPTTYSWTTAGNWNVGTVPNESNADVRVTTNITADTTLNLNQSITLGTLKIGDSAATNSNGNDFNTFTLAPGTGGSLTFDTPSGNARLERPDAGTTNATYNGKIDTVSANLTLNRILEVSIGNSSSNGGITLSGVISGLGGIIRQFPGTGTPTTFSVNSTLRLTNPANSFTGAVRISGGRLEIRGDVPAGANSALGNSNSAIVIGDSTTTGTANASSAELALLTTDATSNHVFGRNLDFSQGGGSTAWRTAFNFNSNATGVVTSTNTLALSADIKLGTRSTLITAQRRGMTINLTGDITGSGGQIFWNAIGAGFSTTGGAQGGVIRLSDRARTYTNDQTLTNGTLVILGSVPASGSSPIGTKTITLADGNGGNIVTANGQHGIRSLFLDNDGTTFARPLSLGGGTNTTTYNGTSASFTVYNGYRLGGLNTTGKVTFSAAISSADPAIGNAPYVNQTITTGQNLALLAAAGGTVEFSGVINDTPNDTPPTNHTTRITINQFRNHPQLDTNTSGTTGTPDTGGAAGSNANDAIGTPTGGTVILSAANEYAGGTEVLGGTLLANNTSGSATGTGTVTVQSGARLGGTGTITGNVTINTGGGLAFTLSTLPGAHDKLDLGGTLTFAGSNTLAITASNSSPTTGTYTLLTATGGTGSGTLPTLTLPSGWAATLQRSGNNLNLVVTAIAPPAAPTGLAATVISTSQINLSWTASATATTYSVKRATVSGGPYNSVVSGLSTTNYNDATGLSAGTTHYYVVSATNDVGESSNSSQTSATTWTAIQAWRVSKGLALNALDTADPDNDGLNNLLEYALDRNPLAADSTPPTTGSIESATGRLQLTFLRARSATELTYTVQASGDLVTWSDLVTNPGTVGNSVTVTDTPPAAAIRRFLRLKVATP